MNERLRDTFFLPLATMRTLIAYIALILAHTLIRLEKRKNQSENKYVFIKKLRKLQ